MHGFFFSLRFRLILLVLCAIIPALGLMLHSGFEQRQIAATQAKEEALRLARLLSNSQNELIEGGRHLLYTLAQLPQVRNCDSAFCCALFADLLKQYPWYLNIGAAEPDGHIFASAVPMAQPINIADRSYFQLALQTRSFAIGDYQVGRIVGKPVVNFGYPVLDEAGNPKAVLFVALNLAWLNQLAARADLPLGSTLTVMNHNGLVLARHPEPEKWVGRSMREEFLFKAIGSQGEGMTEATGMDGVQRLYAFTAFGGPVHAGRIYAKIGIPTSVAFAQVNRLLNRNLILLAFISLMALAVAWIGGDLLVRRRMSKLVSAAKRLGAGDLSVRTGVTYGEGELSQLARAFDEMAASLQQRESERKKAEEALQENRQALETVVETAPSLIVLTNPEGRIRLFNRACEELTGYKREEVLGKTIPELFLPPEWVPVVQKRFSDPYAPEVRAPHENPWTTKSGEERLIEWRCTPLPSSQDGQPWILGTGIDITDRKQAQEALRRSEEEARRLAQENAIVAEIGRIISSTLKIEEVYDRFAEEVRKLMPGDRISIAIGNLEESSLTTAYVWGFEMADRKAGDIIPMAGTTSERVMRTRSSMLTQEQNLEEVGDKFPGALPYFQAGFRSMMVVPLVSKDQVIGVLHIRSFKPNAYTHMHVTLAERVGNQIAGAIANALLHVQIKQAERATKRLAEEMEIIANIGRIVGSTLNIDEVYERFAEEVKKLIPFDRITINVIDHKENMVSTPYVSGIPVPGRQPGETFPLEESLTGEVVWTRSGLILQMEDEDEIARRFPLHLPVFRAGVRSTLKVPLISKDQVIGTLTFHSLKGKAYSNQDLKVAESIGSQIAGAIANARLHCELKQAEEASQRLAKETEIIANIGRIISSTLNIEEVYERFAIEVRKIIDFDRMAIGIVNLEKETIAFPYVAGISVPGRETGDVMPLSGAAIEEVVRKRSSLILQKENESEIARWLPGFLPAFRAGLRSTMLVPLISCDQVIGALALSSQKPDYYTDQDIKLAESIANQVAGAIANALLFNERNRAEQALRKSQQFLEKTFSSLQDAAFIIDANTVEIKDCNSAASEVFGYSRHEMLGKTTTFLHVDQASLEEFRRHLYSAIEKKGFLHQLEFKMKRKDGTIFPSEHTVTQIEDEQGKRIAWVSVVRDITEHKQAEEALQKSEEEAKRLAQENAILANIGRIISSTFSIEEVYKLFSEEVKKLLSFDRIVITFIHGEGNTLVNRYVEGTPVPGKSQGEIFPMAGTVTEAVLQNRKGLIFQTEDENGVAENFPGILPEFKAGLRSFLSVPLIAGDQVIGGLHFRSKKYKAFSEKELRIAESIANQIAGAIANVQLFLDRKRAEEQLKRSEEHFRSLIENSSDIIMTIDRNQNISYVSPSIKRILGYEPEHQLGWNVFQSVHPDDLPLVQDFVNKILQNRRQEIPWSIEHRVKHADGSWRTFQSIGMSILDDSGSPVIIINSRDITERKNLEGQLAQAQKLEAIGQLAAGIAHDFNNILAAIIGYTELAIWDLPENSKVNDKLKEALKASRRARDLVRQILTFSRQESEGRKPMEMAPIVKETIKLLRASLPSNIEIRQQIERDTLVINTNPTQIHQVLMNLCTNAAHAMRGNGGLLEISLSKVDIDALVAAQYPDIHPGAYVKLSVRDTGHGMTTDILAKIFDPYFTTKQVGEGSGLGLAVVHGIVKSHGGEITVYSEPGKGTTFHVYFPRIEDAKGIVDMQKVEPFPMGRGENILFIDDEQALVDIGKKMLEYLGYKVSVRTSSIEALELFRAKGGQFDLVITDMTMPNMTGDKLAREIMRIRPGIPIILCTGFSEHISEEKAKEMGIREFVMKPLVMGDLARTIRRVLDHKEEKI